MRQLEKRFDWLRLCKLIIQTTISRGEKNPSFYKYERHNHLCTRDSFVFTLHLECY